MAESDDCVLLEAWRGGDRRRGEELFRRHGASVSRMFANKVPEVAEDLVQRTFIACLEGRVAPTGSNVRAYLLGPIATWR